MVAMSAIEEILALKKEKNAVILAHNYQIGPIQDIADLVGDSLELSRAAAVIDCEVIVYCGVDFMAETACILSPDKKVILPASDAWCPMAHMITAEQLREVKDAYPGAATVCYVNSTAEVKAESDICCTSANGVSVVNSLDQKQAIFVPDGNLAKFVARHTRKEIIPWNGYCYVHDRYTPDEVRESCSLHPDAEVLVHPECKQAVIDLADHVYSTSGMGKHAQRSDAKEFIIGTEVGMLYRLKKENPNKEFYPLSEKAICQNMKKTDLGKVLMALRSLEPLVKVPDEISYKARRSIEKMLVIE
jgi:quinolinate synthase